VKSSVVVTVQNAYIRGLRLRVVFQYTINYLLILYRFVLCAVFAEVKVRHLEPNRAAFKQATAHRSAYSLSSWISGRETGRKCVVLSTGESGPTGRLNVGKAMIFQRFNRVILIGARGRENNGRQNNFNLIHFVHFRSQAINVHFVPLTA
jgi:hypothetical protein